MSESEYSATDIARLIIKWEELQKECAHIEGVVKGHVLKTKKSLAIGDVMVTYRNPRRSWDYESGAITANAPKDVVELFTKTSETVNWRAVCEHLGLDKEQAIPSTVSEPSASMKLKG